MRELAATCAAIAAPRRFMPMLGARNTYSRYASIGRYASRAPLCRQGRKEVADLAVEPLANHLQHIEADVLLRHLQALQGRLRHPDAAGERNLPLLPSRLP